MKAKTHESASQGVWTISTLTSARIAAVLVICLTAVLRLWDLEIKPPHFDEGINGWFAHQMRHTGYYKYNHENFHGPLYFYLIYMFQTFFGSELFAIRLPAVLGSMLLVVGLMMYQSIFGRAIAWLAALCAAVSPGQVFYGRYSIHESWFAASLVFTVLGLLGLWKYGTARYLWLLVAGVVVAVSLKETFIIHFGCMAIALGCCWVYTVKWRRESFGRAPQVWACRDLLHATFAVGIAFLALFTGLFMNWEGLASFFRGMTSWIGTGVSQESGHEKAWHYWFSLLWQYEHITLFGLALSVRFLWRCDVRMRYLAIYALGTFLAYSIISYKTPWCIISFQWVFFLTSAYIFVGLIQKFPISKWAVGLLLLAPLLRTLPLNWVHHSKPSEAYAYVTTSVRIWDGIRPLLELVEANPRNAQLKGFVALESYYPLPWMLHQFSNVGYGPLTLPLEMDFVIVDAGKVEELPASYEGYQKIVFQIRDGQTDSALLVRPEIMLPLTTDSRR